MMILDHIIWAVPDLDSGIENFARLTGLEAVRGGSHEGMGTRNALISLGGAQYLEILAPDPKQNVSGTLGAILQDVEPGLWTFAMRCDDLSTIVAIAARQGLTVEGPIAMNRPGRDGVEISWQLAFCGETEFGPAAPFYIDWKDASHPTMALPPGLEIVSLEIASPDTDNLAAFYSSMSIDLPVVHGKTGLRAVVAGPNGVVALDYIDVARHPELRATPDHMFKGV